MEWAWPVVSGYRLLGQVVAGQMTVGFDPDWTVQSSRGSSAKNAGS